MATRFIMKDTVPELYKYQVALDTKINSSGIDQTLLELIKIRASQINKCGYCLDKHTSDALSKGETAPRIFALNAWQESNLFTAEEKAALQLTEEVTLISFQGLADDTYQRLQQFFDTVMIGKLTMAVIMINAWNRSAISTLIQPDK